MSDHNDNCLFQACSKIGRFIKDEHSVTTLNSEVFQIICKNSNIILINNT